MKMFSIRLDDQFRDRVEKVNKQLGLKSISAFFMYAAEKLFREMGV